MCGIIGYSGKEEMKEEDLKILLYFAEERGDESCGVATPDTILKKAEDPHEFISRSLPTAKTVLGHTRQATVGEVSDPNSHPFTQGNIVGVHNGSIYNFTTLQRDEDTDFNVDSEIIWHLFNKYPIKKALPKLSGWLGLGWIDEDDRLNLYRHNAPLYIGYRDDSLYFGSKEHYLESINCEDIEEIDRWTRYIINEGEIIETHDLSKVTFRPSHTRSSGRLSGKTGGQNTQVAGRKAGQTKFKEEEFPKSNRVPSSASFLSATHPPGVGYFYWFSMSGQNTLYVQASSLLVDDFEPKIDRFNLKNVHDVGKMERRYPELTNCPEIYRKIPANIR